MITLLRRQVWLDSVKYVIAWKGSYSPGQIIAGLQVVWHNVIERELIPCQHVLTPATGTGPSQPAETAGTARTPPGCHVMGLPVHAVTHGHQSRIGNLAASAPADLARSAGRSSVTTTMRR